MNLRYYQRGGNKQDKPQLIRAAHFFAEQLFDEQQLDNLNIDIHVRILPNDYYGFMVAGVSSIRGRLRTKYDIYISKKSTLVHKIATLAHELVHVSQMDTGRLVYKTHTREGLLKTVEFDGILYTNVQAMDYNKYPWEIEAHKMDQILLKKWHSQYDRH